MTRREHRIAFVKDVDKLLQFCFGKMKEGLIDYFYIGEVWRRQITQDWLLKQGWTKVKHSNHQDFRAIDLFFFKNEKKLKNNWNNAKYLDDIGNYWESLSEYNKWGGHYKSFCDIAHFERLLKPR